MPWFRSQELSQTCWISSKLLKCIPTMFSAYCFDMIAFLSFPGWWQLSPDKWRRSCIWRGWRQWRQWRRCGDFRGRRIWRFTIVFAWPWLQAWQTKNFKAGILFKGPRQKEAIHPAGSHYFREGHPCLHQICPVLSWSHLAGIWFELQPLQASFTLRVSSVMESLWFSYSVMKALHLCYVCASGRFWEASARFLAKVSRPFFCCFTKNIPFQANRDNYCLLLRIGFWWNFGDLQVSKEVHQSQPHLAQPTCIHCPQTLLTDSRC